MALLFSSEPGYYEDGKFGIRLENIVMAVAAETQVTQISRELSLSRAKSLIVLVEF